MARVQYIYRTPTIIPRGLYILAPLFTTIYIAEGLVFHKTKKGDSSIFGSKISGFKSRAGYNGLRTVNCKYRTGIH